MMFPCLPVGNEHEWCILRGFVGQYSEHQGKVFRVVGFPERDNRNTKEPEVLLEVLGEDTHVAIERKSIVPTTDHRYMANHRNGHHLFDCFLKELDSHGCDYSDTLYRLTVHQRDLNERKQQEIPNIAGELASEVIRNWYTIDWNSWCLRGETPISWDFRTVPPEERDFIDPDSGIIYTIGLENTLLESPMRIEEKRLAYAQEFERQAIRAADKFAKYADHRRLLLVQFFGETLGGVGYEEVLEMIKSGSLPMAIDEVWVARQEWVGPDESEIVWERAR